MSETDYFKLLFKKRDILDEFMFIWQRNSEKIKYMQQNIQYFVFNKV